MLGRIKLAWWRDSLEALDRARPPAEPVLAALAKHVLPAGVSGAELAAMEEGWAILLSAEPLEAADLRDYARRRGGLLFRYSARLLGGDEAAAHGGESWALIDFARRSADAREAEAAAAAARADLPSGAWPARLRPLGMLAMLARRDSEPARARWEPQGSPARMLRMLRHRLTGR